MNLHAIEPTVATGTASRRWPGNSTPSSRRSYGIDVAPMAWDARNLISTQVRAVLGLRDLVQPLRDLRREGDGTARLPDGRRQQRLCGNQISGAPSHRRDVVFVAASARWRGDSTPSTQRCPGSCGSSMAWRFTKDNLTHWMISTQRSASSTAAFRGQSATSLHSKQAAQAAASCNAACGTSSMSGSVPSSFA